MLVVSQEVFLIILVISLTRLQDFRRRTEDPTCAQKGINPRISTASSTYPGRLPGQRQQQ